MKPDKDTAALVDCGSVVYQSASGPISILHGYSSGVAACSAKSQMSGNLEHKQ